MSPRPSQGPAHTGTAGLSQPTGISSHTQGEGPSTHGTQLKPGITGTDNIGTCILRPHRLLYNSAKPHQSPPIPRGIPSNTPHPHRNQCKSRYHYRTLHLYSWSTGRTNTNPLSVQGDTHTPITPHIPRYKTRYHPGTPY